MTPKAERREKQAAAAAARKLFRSLRGRFPTEAELARTLRIVNDYRRRARQGR